MFKEKKRVINNSSFSLLLSEILDDEHKSNFFFLYPTTQNHSLVNITSWVNCSKHDFWIIETGAKNIRPRRPFLKKKKFDPLTINYELKEFVTREQVLKILRFTAFYSPITCTITVLRRGYTSVSTKTRDCHVPKATCPSTIGNVLSGHRSMDLRWEWALEGCWYEARFGISFSRIFRMSLSRLGSYSVRIRMPVACGANTCAKPFLMPDFLTTSSTS